MLLKQVHSAGASLEIKFRSLRDLGNRRVFGNDYRKIVRRELIKATSLLCTGTRFARIEAYREFADFLYYDETKRADFSRRLQVTWRSVFRKQSIRQLLRTSLRKIERGPSRFSAGLASMLLGRASSRHVDAYAHFLRYSDTRVAKDALVALSDTASELRATNRRALRTTAVGIIGAMLRAGSVDSKFALGLALGRHFCEQGTEPERVLAVVDCLPKEQTGAAASVTGIALALGERGYWLLPCLKGFLARRDDDLSFYVLTALPHMGPAEARESLALVCEFANELRTKIQQLSGDTPENFAELLEQTHRTLDELSDLLPKSKERDQG